MKTLILKNKRTLFSNLSFAFRLAVSSTTKPEIPLETDVTSETRFTTYTATETPITVRSKSWKAESLAFTLK